MTVVLYPVQVQGKGAEVGIARAIRQMAAELTGEDKDVVFLAINANASELGDEPEVRYLADFVEGSSRGVIRELPQRGRGQRHRPVGLAGHAETVPAGHCEDPARREVAQEGCPGLHGIECVLGEHVGTRRRRGPGLGGMGDPGPSQRRSGQSSLPGRYAT